MATRRVERLGRRVFVSGSVAAFVHRLAGGDKKGTATAPHRFRRRPYRVECTGSLSTSEVKQHRARLVLGWGTAWEDLRVLSAFCMFGIPSSSAPPGFLLGLFGLVHSMLCCASSFHVVVLPPMSSFLPLLCCALLCKTWVAKQGDTEAKKDH